MRSIQISHHKFKLPYFKTICIFPIVYLFSFSIVIHRIDSFHQRSRCISSCSSILICWYFMLLYCNKVLHLLFEPNLLSLITHRFPLSYFNLQIKLYSRDWPGISLESVLSPRPIFPAPDPGSSSSLCPPIVLPSPYNTESRPPPTFVLSRSPVHVHTPKLNTNIPPII